MSFASVLRDSFKFVVAMVVAGTGILLFFATWNIQLTLGNEEIRTRSVFHHPVVFFLMILIVALPIAIYWSYKQHMSRMPSYRRNQFFAKTAGYFLCYFLAAATVVKLFVLAFPLEAHALGSKGLFGLAVGMWILFSAPLGCWLSRKIFSIYT